MTINKKFEHAINSIIDSDVTSMHELREKQASACMELHKEEQLKLLTFLNVSGYFMVKEDVDLVKAEFDLFNFNNKDNNK